MELDIDIDDIITSCSKREKKDLYKALLEDGDVLSEKERMQKVATPGEDGARKAYRTQTLTQSWQK